MKLVYARADELFAELRMKGIGEARAEAVAIRKPSNNIRWIHFYFYVTAKIDDDVFAQVVVPYHHTIEEIAKQQQEEIDTKESILWEDCMGLARKFGIKLLRGAYWEEGREPFMGALKEDEEFEIPF